MNNENENKNLTPQDDQDLITTSVTDEDAAVDLIVGNDEESSFVLMFDEEESEEEFNRSLEEEEDEIGDAAVPPAKYGRRAAKKAGSLFPRKGDRAGEVLRKCVFLAALLALLGSGVYLVYDMVYLPMMNEKTYDGVADLYNPDDPAPLPEEYENMEFPQGMTNVLKAMYAENNDLRGFITFTSDKKDFLDIRYPVMYSGDNKYYLNHDFYKKKNSNGALFFDERNWAGTFKNNDKISIIYGHNNLNSQMFSNVVQLTTDLDKARDATTISLETLYGNDVYRVFAICMFDEDAKAKYYYNYCQTAFANDVAFMQYVREIRARSYWNYDNVDVRPEDDLLVLSTCTTEYTSKLKNGRIAVFARKIRAHESYENEPELITKNKNVVMPYNWYVKHKKTVSKYYTKGGLAAFTENTSTTTGDSKTTTLKDGDKDETTLKDGKTTTTKKGQKTTTTKKGQKTTTKKGQKTTTTKKGATTTGTVTDKSTTEKVTTTTEKVTTTTTEQQTTETTTTTTVAAEE